MFEENTTSKEVAVDCRVYMNSTSRWATLRLRQDDQSLSVQQFQPFPNIHLAKVEPMSKQ